MKLIRTILILSILLTVSVVSFAQKGNRKVGIPEKMGDCNYDDHVDVEDMIVMANFLAGNKDLLDEDDLEAVQTLGDVLKDGKIDIRDLSILANYIAGNIDVLPLYPH